MHHLTACGDSAALDLARPFTDLHAVVDVPEAELPDARVLDPYVPHGTPVRVVSGRDETGVAMRAAACPATVGATGLTEAMPPPSYCLALPR